MRLEHIDDDYGCGDRGFHYGAGRGAGDNDAGSDGFGDYSSVTGNGVGGGDGLANFDSGGPSGSQDGSDGALLLEVLVAR